MEYNAAMFSLLREAAGMTQSAMSQATGFSQAIISKIESGLRTPSDPEVARIAEVLDHPTEIFRAPERVYKEGAFFDFLFRKKMVVRQRSLSAVIARLELMAIYLKPLFEAVEYEPPFQFPATDFIKAGKTPADIAQMVRHLWRIPSGPIADLVAIVEATGVMVVPFDFEDDKIDAVSICRPDLPRMIFADFRKSADRLRFSIAHELGHLVMHLVDEFIDESERDIEGEADSFAGNFLAPADDIRPHFFPGIGLDDFGRLKHKWRMSMKALIYRAAEVKKISPEKKVSLYKLMSYHNWSKSEPWPIASESPHFLSKVVKTLREELDFTVEELSIMTRMKEKKFRQVIMGEILDREVRVSAKIIPFPTPSASS